MKTWYQTISSSTFANTFGSTFTLPGAGTYLIEYHAIVGTTGGSAVMLQLFNATLGAIVAGSQVSAVYHTSAGTENQTATCTVLVTILAANVMTLQWARQIGTATLYNTLTGAANNTSGTSTISWVQISGAATAVAAMTGATGGSAGTSGSVPAPPAGTQAGVLLGSAGWTTSLAITDAVASVIQNAAPNGSLTLYGNGTGQANLDTTGAGAVRIGDNATSINIGNTVAGRNVNVGGTGTTLNIGAASTIISGTAAFNSTVSAAGGVNLRSSVQFGTAAASGGIAVRFNATSTFTYVGGYNYLTVYGFGPTGSVSTNSGSSLWSMEVDGRILGHAEIDLASDGRVKKDVASLDLVQAVATIKALRPVSYVWDDGRADTGTKLGFIAQEVGEAGVGNAVAFIPGKVCDAAGSLVDVEDYHSLDYNQLHVLTMAALKNALSRIEQLEAQMALKA